MGIDKPSVNVTSHVCVCTCAFGPQACFSPGEEDYLLWLSRLHMQAAGQGRGQGGTSLTKGLLVATPAEWFETEGCAKQRGKTKRGHLERHQMTSALLKSQYVRNPGDRASVTEGEPAFTECPQCGRRCTGHLHSHGSTYPAILGRWCCHPQFLNKDTETKRGQVTSRRHTVTKRWM